MPPGGVEVEARAGSSRALLRAAAKALKMPRINDAARDAASTRFD
jgi:hypothetical protein